MIDELRSQFSDFVIRLCIASYCNDWNLQFSWSLDCRL